MRLSQSDNTEYGVITNKESVVKRERKGVGTCIHEVFEARAAHSPQAQAVSFEAHSLTYGELNRRANQLAHYLTSLSVRPDVPVGIYLNRSVEMIIGMLGILKAGGAYVPLDPTYPRERIAFMIEDSKLQVLLTHESLAANWHSSGAHVVRLDADSEKIARQPDADPKSRVLPANLGYVIYTSGSTGRPKGVSVNHSSVVHLFETTQPLFGFGPSDVWTVSHSYAFDFSVWEIFGALLSGGRLVIAPLRVTQSPREFYQLLLHEKVTILSLTPTALRQLTQTGLPADALQVRLVVGGGDAFPSNLAPELLRWNVPVWNFYGPTESTVWAMIKPIAATDVQYSTIPLGRALDGIEAYVLDEDLQPVAPGLSGELHLGGSGLARGYFQQPALTAERFVPTPFCTRGGERLYKTGDLARYLRDGNVEYLGRMDYQVKLRGFRIELEEIENVLIQHATVDQCVVVMREDQPADQRLVAYVTPVRGREIAVNELSHLARTTLPEYMVPAAFVVMEKLPLTANNKVARLALPAPPQTRRDLKRDFAGPRTATEELLAQIWAEVLYVDRVGIHDDFFELGGHSLLATRMVSRIRDAFQVDLPLRHIFDHSTVAQLADIIENFDHAGGDLSTLCITSVSRKGPLPLSFPQERVWFLQQLFPNSLAYNFQSTLKLTGTLKVAALEQSLTEIISRHEIFRTTFPAVDGKPIQIIHEPWSVKLEIIDLETLPQKERQGEAEHRIGELLQLPFDLQKLPLIRWTLLRLSETEHILLHVEHHLVHDGWSFNVFLNELLVLYRAFVGGEESSLGALPIQFADFAVWQHQWMQGASAKAQLEFWRQKLSGTSTLLQLPADRPRPALQSFRGASKRVELPLELCEALREFSRAQGTTLFMTMFATFEILLHRLTGQEDFCVGAGIANRRWPETESMIGMVVNTVALRASLSDKPTFLELLRQVRTVALEAYTHQDLPFERVVDVIQTERDLSRNPLFQIMFNFHDAPLPELKLPGLEIELVEVVSNKSAKFDLNVIVVPRSEQRAGSGTKHGRSGITIIWEYNTDLFDEATVLGFEEVYRTLLQAVVAAPETRVTEFPLLAPDAQKQLIRRWKGHKTAYPRLASISQLFAEQVERTPDARALVCGDQLLSYDELNRKANQLAHYLREKGVGPEVLVGLCVERSLEMIIGLLGILKAGGAYVPLDYDYPLERFEVMLKEAQITLLLTQEKFADKLRAQIAEVTLLDKDWDQIAAYNTENPPERTTADNLAYVIYTSGSTGKPKTVGITHRNVARLVKNTNYATLNAHQVFLQFAPLSFDASTFEIWGSLLNGACLTLMSPGPASLEALGAAVRNYGVTTLWLTAGLFQQMVDDQLESLRGLDQLLAGGDVLSLKHVETVVRQLPHCQVINGYGPTENTTFSCCHRVKVDEKLIASVPIGQPVSNSEAFILDQSLTPLPPGVTGELYLAGDGLARAYLNDAEATAEKFIPHLFSDEPGLRLYKSGDQARYRRDGIIEFLGRVDRQVKLRGFRIELGEIEASLRQYGAVRDCVVILRDDLAGPQLIAYYIPTLEGRPQIEGLRDYAKRSLPHYMVPALFVPVGTIPLTANGKIDLSALPTLDHSLQDSMRTFVSPRTAGEEKLVAIWTQVLGDRKIGVHDNFFDLGGHSLLATQVMSRIRETFKVNMPLRYFFEKPTVAGLAEFLRDARSEDQKVLPEIRRLPRG
jgi:amino acid adenylation domain-containing protein